MEEKNRSFLQNFHVLRECLKPFAILWQYGDGHVTRLARVHVLHQSALPGMCAGNYLAGCTILKHVTHKNMNEGVC